MKYYILPIVAIILVVSLKASKPHPSLVISAEEANQIRESLGSYSLLDKSYEKIKAEVEAAMANPIEVPLPGEAGGYEHERHKQNYRDMHKAGLLFAISADTRYAEFVKSILDKYAELYPTLGAHPLAHNQKPGKLFHQMLNEAVWLVNTSIAYDCIYNWLSEAERTRYENNIFRPMVEWFTVRNAKELDRIHNHGTWTVASVGMIGFVLDDDDLVEIALRGSDKSGKGGFLKQIEKLFSPDGYYMEGPYYVRYALRPFFKFAESIERNQPELGIYELRNSILKKAYYSAVETTFPNGVFPPINDASRTMNLSAPGLIRATAIVFDRYGEDDNLLGVADYQAETILSGSGLKLAKALAEAGEVPHFSWESREFLDGYDGEKGGLGILRSGVGAEQTVLLMKYGVHGMGHGHFDKLHFIFYDQGREIIPDYGFSRWINIEPKFGGRYLPENTSYAKQTIAHNTVVVDGKSQNEGNRNVAEKMFGNRHFFHSDNKVAQIMSAQANNYYPGVNMQRTMLLVADKRLEYPIVVDIYRLSSDQEHQYDYPIHYRGQIITTNFEYNSNSQQLRPLGSESGYQHIWNQGEADINGIPKITWLDGNRYYSCISAPHPDFRIFFGLSGANDPNFNLHTEPLFIFRISAKDAVFATVIEPHGFFNEAQEASRDARGRLHTVTVLTSNSFGTVIEVEGWDDYHLLIKVNNGKPGKRIKHTVVGKKGKYHWSGDFAVEFE